MDFRVPYADLAVVDERLRKEYAGWASRLNSKGMSFFHEHTPTLVLIRYGQDEQILRRDTKLEDEATKWAAPFRWGAIQKVGYAGAHVAR